MILKINQVRVGHRKIFRVRVGHQVPVGPCSGASSGTCLGHHLGHLGQHLGHIVNNGQQSTMLHAALMPFFWTILFFKCTLPLPVPAWRLAGALTTCRCRLCQFGSNFLSTHSLSWRSTGRSIKCGITIHLVALFQLTKFIQSVLFCINRFCVRSPPTWVAQAQSEGWEVTYLDVHVHHVKLSNNRQAQ